MTIESNFKSWFPIWVAIFVSGSAVGGYLAMWTATGSAAARNAALINQLDQRMDLNEQKQVVNTRRLESLEAWQGQIMQLSDSRDTRIRAVENAVATFTSEIAAVRSLLTQIVAKLDEPKDKT